MAKTPHKPNKHRNRTPDIPKRSSRNRFNRHRVEPGGFDSVEGVHTPKQYFGIAPDIDLATRVLFQDRMLLVIDKPAGIPCHAGPSGQPNLEAGLDQLRFGSKDRPTLAHRLDQDTSGCLAIARGPKGAKRLGRLFQEGLPQKTYWAVVEGGPADDAGRIDAPLLKISSKEEGWRMIVDPAGKTAITEWKVLGRANGQAWIEFKPQTGRTHQIRVHAAHLGCPIVGDIRYGASEESLLCLLARSLVLPVYQERPNVVAEAEAAPHMASALEAFSTDATP
jgi:tRNA pseudouridine32 synthase/23S rRNA pseudouridine746 synthase/23S rRNA pseudouridine1911/1915/1917 synthase